MGVSRSLIADFHFSDIFHQKCEISGYKTDPSKADTDGDEFNKGTNPLKADSDGDFWNDSMDMQPRDAMLPNAIVIGVAGAVAVALVAWRLLLRRKTSPRGAPSTHAVVGGYCVKWRAELGAHDKFCPICGSTQST